MATVRPKGGELLSAGYCGASINYMCATNTQRDLLISNTEVKFSSFYSIKSGMKTQ